MTNAFKLIIGNYYQPSSDKDTSIEQLKISRDRINQNAKSTIILDGDFNFDHINWDIPCTMNNFLISLKNINLNRLSDSKKPTKGDRTPGLILTDIQSIDSYTNSHTIIKTITIVRQLMTSGKNSLTDYLHQ